MRWRSLLFVLSIIISADSRADVAITCDGNGGHDRDDYGALPVACAILSGEAVTVHVDFSSHFGSGESSVMRSQMRTSGYGARDRFLQGVPFYDHSVGNLAQCINQASASNRLQVLLMGPAEVLWRGMSGSDRAKHKYVDIRTHSGWNNNHEHSGTHNLGDIKRVFKTVRIIKIADQNRNLSQPISSMYWARDSANPNMNWIYSRVVASRKRNGTVADISDAGLAMHLVTGNASATMTDVRRQIEHK